MNTKMEILGGSNDDNRFVPNFSLKDVVGTSSTVEIQGNEEGLKEVGVFHKNPGITIMKANRSPEEKSVDLKYLEEVEDMESKQMQPAVYFKDTNGNYFQDFEHTISCMDGNVGQTIKLNEVASTSVEQQKEMKYTVRFTNTEEAQIKPAVVFRDNEGNCFLDKEYTMPYMENIVQKPVEDKTEQLPEKIHVLVTDCVNLIDDMTLNKPMDGKERAIILWRKIEELPLEHQEKVKAEIFKGNVEYEAICNHEAFWNAIKDQVSAHGEPTHSIIATQIDSEYETWISGYVKKDGWIYICEGEEKKRYRQLFNCDLQCMEIQEIYDDNTNVKKNRRVLVIKVKTDSDERKFSLEMSWESKKMEKLFREVIGFQVSKWAQFERDMKNLLTTLASSAKKSMILVKHGWRKVSDKMFYVYDRRDETFGYKIQCGKYILQDNRYSTIDIWKMVMNVFTNANAAGPILLYSLYGITYQLFLDAGYRPTTILFVAGETGAMKTSVSKVFFTMFNTDEDSAVMPFQSTVASLDPAISESNDMILLVDDYCPNSTMTNEGRKQMEQLLDRLIRIYGDATGRMKSNVDSRLVKSSRAKGGAVATGEIEAEGRSSVLRMVTMQLRRGDISGDNLSFFQKEKKLWSTFLARYIGYLEKNYISIVDMITPNYSILRSETQNWLNEKRNIDHYVELSIINRVLMEFLKSEGLQLEEVQGYFDILNAGLVYHISKSEVMAEEQNPDTMILDAVVNVLNNGAVRLAKSLNEYTMSTEYFGYREMNVVYVEEVKFKGEVKSYLEKTYGYKGLKIRTFLKSLYDKFGVIERFKNGGNNYKYTTTKRKGDKKIPFVVVDLEKAEAILEKK